MRKANRIGSCDELTPSCREECERAIARIKRLRHDENQYADMEQLRVWAGSIPSWFICEVIRCALTGHRFRPNDARGPLPESNSIASAMTLPEDWKVSYGQQKAHHGRNRGESDPDANGGWGNVVRAAEEDR